MVDSTRGLTEGEVNTILRALLVLVDRSEPTPFSHGDISAIRVMSDLETLINKQHRRVNGAAGADWGHDA